MIIRRFEEKVERHKDRVAVKAGEMALTYGELNRFANCIAYTITSQYDTAGLDCNGQTAALLFNKGIGQVAALLGVLKARKIYVPFDITYPRKRFEYMLTDSNVRMILTDHRNIELAKKLKSVVKEDIIIINIDGIDEKKPCNNLNIEDSPDQIAYILYTSGSTGKPKGVVQTCRNVVFYTDNYIKALSITPADRLTFISSFSHDGAVQDIYASILSGAALYPIDIRKEPAAEIFRTLIKEKITVYHSVSTVFRYFADSLTKEEMFSSLRLIVTGGEPLRQADIACVKQFFHGVLLAHMYGQTESSVNTMGFVDVEKEGSTITIGDALEGVELLLVKEDGEEVIGSEIGEIVVACDFIAPGYWRNPEASAASFLYDEELGKVYRTGDLGRIHYSGKIEFVGRKDNQVKIRGYRVEPREIETLLQDYEGIQDAVVAAKDAAEIKALCAYFTAEEEIEATVLRDFLSGELPEYMIPVYFMQVEKMPLTPGGKIDRNALPVPVIGDKAAFTAPRNAVEENLCEIWSEILRVGKDIIGIDTNFFELGGHSLNALQLIAQVHKKMNVRIPLAEIFERPFIRQLAQYVSNASPDKYIFIESVEKKEYYPLSSAQKRLYFLQQMDVNSTAYNLFYTFPLGKTIEIKKLEAAIKKLIDRHESLRTSFFTVKDEPIQRVHDHVEFEIEFFDLAAKALNSAVKSVKERKDEKNIIGHFLLPFTLSQAPLVRSGLVRVPDQNHIWLVDIHHIVSDGTSHMILTEDFVSLYNEEELELLPLQYKDFVLWQNDLFKGGKIKDQENYWLRLYGDTGEISRLQLPEDYRRPEVFTYAGDICGFTLGGEDAVEFKALASGHGGTLYMNMLTALNVLFYKYSGQTDIIIGAGIAGRPHPDLQGIIGMFVNTLAMRNFPGGKKTYESFFKDVIANSVRAFENQDVQFEDLVEKLDVERDTSRNPLFDILMVAQNFRPMAAVEREDLSLAQESHDLAGHRYTRSAAKFDMTFFVFENAEDIHIDIEYYTGIFKEETIRRMISHLNNIIQLVVKTPSIKLEEIDVLSPVERRQILFEFNNTAADYPRDKTIQELFNVQVERTPDHVAIVDVGTQHALLLNGNQLTYQELNENSNQLMRVLRDKGVQPDTIVGILLGRSIEMIIGILGILKAGCAYLPIEPDIPQERIDFMLKDSNARVLVSEVSEVCEGTEVVKLSELREEYLTHLTQLSHPTQLCYVIYTSGSTGKPRGVLTTHYNVTRVVRNTNYIYLNELDRILQLSNYAFDGSVFDIYGALLNGAALILVPGNKAAAVDHLAEVIKRENITVFFVTTALFNLLVDEEPGIFTYIKRVLFGGESVSVEHTRRALDYSGKDKIIHVYGPTETTVYATYYFVNEVIENISTVPIGRPLSNTTVYILDRDLIPVPIMVCGELYIGGDGVARGYLNNPELTSERFDQDLFNFHNYHDDKKKENYQKFFGGARWAILQKSPPGLLYKTGDLARWLPDGNIEFFGRIDQQVKIRGFRVELGEIEYQLMRHRQVKEAVVIDLEEKINDGGNKFLCAYIVSNNGWGGVELKEYLSGILPGYMIPSFFINVEQIPLTRNGKVDRKKLPGPGIAAGKNYAAPGNEVEKKLVEIWQEVLNLDVNVSIGINDNFFHLGGHSLKAATMAARIHKELDVKVPLIEVFKRQTIRGLAEYVKEAETEKYVSIEAVEQRKYYPLSKAQSGIFVQQQKEDEMTAYNMPQMIPLGFDINGERLEQAFQEMIHRHESLRISFHIEGDEPVQRIHDHVEFNVEYYSSHSPQDIISHFIRPFDLSNAPLLRVGLIKLKEEMNRHILLLDMHHIIIDGVSQEIFREELLEFYNGKELPPLRLQYKDYSVWQNSKILREMTARQKEFWVRAFAGEVPALKMPLDFERPAIRSFEGDHVFFVIDRQLTEKLRCLGEQAEATLYMVLLAAFFVLLSKFGSQEDIVVGSPVTGRRHADLQDILGMFVNMLAIRNRPEVNKIFQEFLREVKASVINSMENQDYHFEELVVELGLQGDRSRNPLFDVVFSMQNTTAGDKTYTANQDPAQQEDHEQAGEFSISKFDLLLHAVEHSSRIIMRFEYCTRLFKRSTVGKISRHYIEILHQVAVNSDIRLGDIKMSFSLAAMEPISFQEDGDFDF
jgi:tyrocidine synthetase-3